MVVAEELDVAEPGGGERGRHLVTCPPPEAEAAQPGVDQPPVDVVGLDAAEPQVHLLGGVVDAGRLVGDVGDPGVGGRARCGAAAR